VCTQDQNSAAAKAYIEVADNVDDIQFGITDKEDLFGEFEITNDDTVVLFKKVKRIMFSLTLSFCHHTQAGS